MKRTHFRAIACFAIAAGTMVAAPARAQEAELIAGWDFSQYLSGLHTVDGETFTDILPANYSSLDPTFGAGAESAAFGTMFIDGSFGSTAVAVDTAEASFSPFSSAPGSLSSNCDALGPCDRQGPLISEGQMFFNLLTMLALEPVSVVFQADLSSVTQTRDSWQLSFGAKTAPLFDGAGDASASIDFSTDGSSYSPVADLLITPVEEQFIVPLGDVTAGSVFVRFNFMPDGIRQPLIDNVAIQVPEPMGAASGAAALLALSAVAAARRRGRAAPAV